MREQIAESYRKIDLSSPPGLPKYLRVCAVIEREIAAGRFKPGQQLPSELELTEALPTSLGTVQKALRSLAERGVLVRLHGKGTFIADPRVDESKLWHLRFLDDNNTLLPVYVHVHAIETIKKKGPWTRFLGDHPYYIHVRRTMDVNHEFTVSARFFVAGPPFRELLEIPRAEFDGTSLRNVLAERFGVSTLRAAEQIGCEPAPAEACAALGLAPGSVALLCDVLGYGFRDAPVYYQRYWIPPNRYRLEAREHSP